MISRYLKENNVKKIERIGKGRKTFEAEEK